MNRKHQHSNLPIPPIEENIFALLFKRAQINPTGILLVSPGAEREEISYISFYERVCAEARRLSDLGLKKGDRICLIFYNSVEFVVLYFAALGIGLVVVPVNPDLAPREIEFIVKNCGASLVTISQALEFKVADLKKSSDSDHRMFRTVEPQSDLLDFSPASDRLPTSLPFEPEVGANDPAVIIYTSGTTGNPKGVVLTHRNFLSDAWAISNWFNFDQETRTLCLLPLFHNNGQVVTLLSPLTTGGSMVVINNKTGFASFWSLVDRFRVTWTSVMPSILSMLLASPQQRNDRSMKGIICGGQVLLRSVQESFESRFSVPVFEGFGLTETTSFACFNRYPAERRKPGSVGVPLPVNEMTILDENGAELGPLTDGEICIRGFNVANEYYGLDELNVRAFRDGWFHSGDFGHKDSEGAFYFGSRKDALIIKGGENIYPAEVENVIAEHGEVEECAVIGIPDPILGEEICAFIKTHDGSTLDEAKVKSYCVGKLAKYKQPKKVILLGTDTELTEIPKGPTKKVLYRELRRYFANRYVEKT